MRRALITLSFVMVACGGAVDQAVDPQHDQPAAQSSSKEPPQTTTSATSAEDNVTTTVEPSSGSDPTGATSDRPVAPEFELSLPGGGSYTLASAEKPIYMVFWAEW